MNIEELFEERKDLMIGLATAESADELRKVLEDNQITITDMSVEEVYDRINNSPQEIGEEDLDQVSGGIALTVGIMAASALGVAGLELCFLAGVAKGYIKKAKKG